MGARGIARSAGVFPSSLSNLLSYITSATCRNAEVLRNTKEECAPWESWESTIAKTSINWKLVNAVSTLKQPASVGHVKTMRFSVMASHTQRRILSIVPSISWPTEWSARGGRWMRTQFSTRIREGATQSSVRPISLCCHTSVQRAKTSAGG